MARSWSRKYLLATRGSDLDPRPLPTHSVDSMGKPYNAVIKKRRRLRYLKRKKAKIAGAKAPKPAAG
ncbi:MAG: hypothetical protein EBT57_02115 [Verrucomicrobia bacterium]|nr:hypothetical protein [Verrucomicrobiota bacterium]